MNRNDESFFDQISGESPTTLLCQAHKENLKNVKTRQGETLTPRNQISGESDTHDVPLDEKVDKMVQDMNAMSDHADEVLKKAEAFADRMKLSKALDEWEPERIEKIRVRNDRNEGWQKRFFLFKTSIGFCCVDEYELNHYISGDRFVVHTWKYAEPIPKTIEVGIDELLKVYSQHTGTNVELIKVKK